MTKLREFEREGVRLVMESDDLEQIAAGTVDYIGFSCYMSTVCSTDPNVERTEGNQFLACKNPYLETSAWYSPTRNVFPKLLLHTFSCA